MKEILFSAEQALQVTLVKRKFAELLKVRDEFLLNLKRDGDLPAWGPGNGETNPQAARAAAASLYGDFFFPDRLERGEDTLTNELAKGYGVVGASMATVELAARFNLEKESFDEKTLKPLRQKMVAVDIGPGRERVSMQLDRAILKVCGLSTLSEIQTARPILILDPVPARIIFTWATISSTTYITVRKVRERLRDMSVTPKIAKALRQLDQLAEDEPLALVRALAPHMRINFGYYVDVEPDVDKKRKESAERIYALKDSLIKYRQKPTSMPVLVQMDDKSRFPKITRPKMHKAGDDDSSSSDGRASRKDRKNSKLEDEAMIELSENLRIYRYKKSKRNEVYESAKWQKILADEGLTG